jgi:hypothetical protein
MVCRRAVWLTLPSIETLVVPEAFRGLSTCFALMMTGLFCMGIIQ